MSTAPSRTRSLRKPGTGANQIERFAAGRSVEISSMISNVVQSPSKLPKPSSSLTASASPLRTSNISRPETSNSNGSMRPPAPKTAISCPPLTSENKASSIRSRARTPTESSSNSSLQRAPSTRHSRNASTGVLQNFSRPASTSSSSTIQTRSRTGSHTPQLHPTSASTMIRPPSSSSHSSLEHRLHAPAHTNAKASITPTSRPAFSTLQQHFSPAKNIAPKPATSSFLAPPSPSKLPSNIQISADTARLQAELLQLHLLHRNVATVNKQYRESARTKLRSRFEDLHVRYGELVELEREEMSKVNALALKAWSPAGSASGVRGGNGRSKSVGAGLSLGWGLEERVQTLDTVLSGVWKLGEPGGKYARCLKRFERWVASVSELLQRRERGEAGLDEYGNVKFVTDLDVEWKDECALLGRKLEGWRDLLRHLSHVGAELGSRGDEPGREMGATASALDRSTLSIILRGVRELVHGMLAEVQAMERIQRAVIRREEEWIKEVIDEGDGEDGTTSVPGAVWRTLVH